MAAALEKFDSCQIRSHDVSKMHANFNHAPWLGDLKNCRWYGPFTKQKDCYTFRTATDSGKFIGLGLSINLGREKYIGLFYFNSDSRACGTHHIYYKDK